MKGFIVGIVLSIVLVVCYFTNVEITKIVVFLSGAVAGAVCLAFWFCNEWRLY
jgi:uncharacterized membrane protein YgaE (UPF0421/DUF939 family)